MIELKELKEKPALKSQRTQTQVPERTLLGVCASGAKATLITLSAILLSWACVEFIFAATHVGEDTVAKPDPLLGYSHLEGQTITFRSEGYSQSTINMEGFRDKLYAVPKPAGVKRVCVVGDSMTMGLEVPLASTYPKMLEKRLQSEGKNVEVINCGMSGTGTGQQYLGWRQKIAALQPDMLIVGYHLGDTDDNVGGGTNPPRPTFLVDSQNKLTIDFKDVDSWFASENSRFYSSFAWFRRNSRILAVLSKLDLDLQADPAYKLVMKAAGKAKASAWNAFLKCLPQGDWQIPQSRDIVTDLLPSPPASASPITVGATPCVAQVNGSPASAGTYFPTQTWSRLKL